MNGNRRRHMADMARVYSARQWELYDLLDQSLDPRGPDSMIELAGEYLRPGAVILDAGCRDAAHLIELVRANDATGSGVDPVEWHIEKARAAVRQAGLGGRIALHLGVMQDVPYPDEHFDLVWCRDVLTVVDELPAALNEAARVLKPAGRMIVYTNFVTERLEPEEAAMLSRSLVNVPARLVEGNVEAAFSDAGFGVERKDVVGTEWREHAEERSRPASEALLRLARLRRRRDLVVERYGQDIYDHVESNLHWLVYQFLGKLRPTVYVLGRRPRR
jgi:ubiquinone/menaquinone biosynthesis C-methylase UbiE